MNDFLVTRNNGSVRLQTDSVSQQQAHTLNCPSHRAETRGTPGRTKSGALSFKRRRVLLITVVKRLYNKVNGHAPDYISDIIQ